MEKITSVLKKIERRQHFPFILMPKPDTDSTTKENYTSVALVNVGVRNLQRISKSDPAIYTNNKS